VLTRIDHVGIAVHDLDAAIERYTGTFGLRLAATETNVEQGVREAMLALSDARLDDIVGSDDALRGAAPASYVQLLEPLEGDTPVGRFLARRGEGLHHVGYAVDDVELALESLATQGISLIDRRARHGSLGASIAFVHPRDLFGVLTELVQTARS
jgi:methylmalonyl-CoA/ethylmalonyl-CoA epimerase